MNTDLPTLTTNELLDRCEEATDVRFSVHQLGDWASEGLLPPSRPGRGRGRGVGGTEGRRWDAECLPRLIVIAQSRAGEHVSVARAARALADAGYHPGAKHLRLVMAACLFDLYRDIRGAIRWNRIFLTDDAVSDSDKRRRFHESGLRRYPEVDPIVRSLAEGLQLLLVGIASKDEADAMHRLVRMFSDDQIASTLHEATDVDISRAYNLAGEALPQILLQLRFALPLVLMMSQVLDRDERVAQSTQALSQLFQSTPNEALVSKLRMPVALLALHGLRQGEQSLQLCEAAIEQVIQTLSSRLDNELVSALKAAIFEFSTGVHVEDMPRASTDQSEQQEEEGATNEE